MGQRVAVLRDGRLQQCGPPRELYNRPANVFVAGFIGSPSMNLLPGRLNGDGRAEVGGCELELPSEVAAAARAQGLRDVTVGLRPESLELDGSGAGIPAEVEIVEELGADAYAFCNSDVRGSALRLIARTDWRAPPERGTNVTLRPRAGEAHVFDPDTGERIAG